MQAYLAVFAKCRLKTPALHFLISVHTVAILMAIAIVIWRFPAIVPFG